MHFRLGPHKASGTLCFYDLSGTIPQGKKNWCKLQFTTLRNNAPAFRQPGHIENVGGLPVIGLLPAIVTMIKEILESYPGPPLSGSAWPTKKQSERLRKALKAVSQPTLAPLDNRFNEEVRVHLEQLSTLAPQFSTDLARLIRVFKKLETPRARHPIPSAELPCSAMLSNMPAQSATAFQAIEVFPI